MVHRLRTCGLTITGWVGTLNTPDSLACVTKQRDEAAQQAAEAWSMLQCGSIYDRLIIDMAVCYGNYSLLL